MQVHESGKALDRVCGEAASEGRQGGKRVSLAAELQGKFRLCCMQMRIQAGECYGFMRRVIKIVSKSLVKLMVQVNCMK